MMTLASPFPFRRILASLAVVLASCGDDRVAGGTSGAEAENAVSARIRLPDGNPAKGIPVVARPSDALTDSVWARGVTDDSGMVRLRLPATREWILEALADSVATFARVDSGFHGEVAVAAGLERKAALSGRFVPTGASSFKLFVAGLGRSAAVGPDGSFFLDGLPAGTVEVRAGDRPEGWSIDLSAGDTTRVSLDLLEAGRTVGSPGVPMLMAYQLPGSQYAGLPIAAEFVLPPGWPADRLRFVAPSGGIVPVQLASFDSASRAIRVWFVPVEVERAGTLRLSLDSLPAGKSTGLLFAGQDLAKAVLFSLPPSRSGTNDAWLDFATGRTQVGNATVSYGADSGIALGAGIVSQDAASMLVLGGSNLPDSLAYASVRLRVADGWSKTVRILELRDTGGVPMARIAHVPDSLVFETSLGRKAFRVTGDSAIWRSYAISRRGSNWEFWIDGDSATSLARDPAQVRGSLLVAEGGRIRLSELFLGAVELPSPKLRMLGQRSYTNFYPAVR